MNHFRHGDVSFHQISEAEAKEIMKKSKLKKANLKTFVVALGESTGHKHVMTLEKPMLDLYGVADFLKDEEVLFALKEPATMTHEEHGPITLTPGFYVRKIEREYDPFSEAARQAMD